MRTRETSSIDHSINKKLRKLLPARSISPRRSQLYMDLNKAWTALKPASRSKTRRGSKPLISVGIRAPMTEYSIHIFRACRERLTQAATPKIRYLVGSNSVIVVYAVVKASKLNILSSTLVVSHLTCCLSKVTNH
jgi:hypothetical protein